MGYADTSENLKTNYCPSATVIGYNTPEATRTNTSYGKMKEMKLITDVYGYAIFTISLDMKSSIGGATAYARLRVNGTAYGAEQSEAAGNYTTKTWNVALTDLKRNDLIQIYGYNDTAPRSILIKNWYIMANESPFYNTLE